MGDTLRAPNTQRGANTQIPPVENTNLRPHLPANNQPRKYDQYPESAAIMNPAATMKPKDTMAPPEAAYYQNLPLHNLQQQQQQQQLQSRQNSSLFLFNTPRQDLFMLGNNYPIGPPPTAPNPTSMQRQGYPGYYMPGRDSMSFPGSQNDMQGRLRGDSISLPHPLQSQNPDTLNFPVSQGAPAGPPPHNPLRSTSIFSSLIQLPDSSRNSVSGPSSKDAGIPDSRQKQGSSSRGYSQDFDSVGKDSFGNIFGWGQGQKVSPAPSKQNTKEFDNQNAFWDQMGNGMGGSISGINNGSLNAFMSSLHNNGSIDFLNMSNEQRRDSIMKFISDQGLRPENTHLMGTSLREDIFDDQRRMSSGSKGRQPSLSEMNHVSPTSSMSSKASKVKDEPHSPRTSPGRQTSQGIDNMGVMQMRGDQHQFNQQQRQPTAFYQTQPHDSFGFPYQENPQQYQGAQMRTSFSQFQPLLEAQPQQQYPPRRSRDNYHHMFKGSPFIAPEAVEQSNYYPKTNLRSAGQNDDGKQLVQAQQYARAEDGRPLLGATKVDQLMLVIQAREKGNTTAIKQSQDGSILATPNIDHDKNAVLPLTVDLVGGIDKPQKEELEDDGTSHKKRKRRGKSQECPYCFKQFHQTTHLDVHVRSHIGLKPFECTFCGKRFTQGGNLRTHMRLHTGEKPFVCDVCNRNFSRKGNLAAHMLTHNKEKPFDCKLDNCDKSFTQLGNLKSHQNKFHLPTLTKLTQTFASITGDALAQLPSEEKELLEYFAKLYKNANKGIRGRGKGKRVSKLAGDASPPSPIHHSPEQLSSTMSKSLDDEGHDDMNENIPTVYTSGVPKYQ